METPMNRYLYSLVRCVPDPQTGEFVNIGAIVGDPVTGDWSVRGISNESRIRKFAGGLSLDAAHSFLTRVGLQIDETRMQMDEDAEAVPLGDAWLAALYHDHRNVVQLSPPTPMVAEDAETALDALFARQILDPQSQSREKVITKWRVTHDVRDSYRRASVRPELIQAKPDLYVGSSVHAVLDFAVVSGRALQVSQGWSFRRSGLEEVSVQVKAWAFAISLLRRKEEARVMTATGQTSRIAHDVDLEVVIASPGTPAQQRAYEEADQVFRSLGAHVRDLADVDAVGQRAAELVAIG
jgi:hypothetical protein